MHLGGHLSDFHSLIFPQTWLWSQVVPWDISSAASSRSPCPTCPTCHRNLPDCPVQTHSQPGSLQRCHACCRAWLRHHRSMQDGSDALDWQLITMLVKRAALLSVNQEALSICSSLLPATSLAGTFCQTPPSRHFTYFEGWFVSTPTHMSGLQTVCKG